MFELKEFDPPLKQVPTFNESVCKGCYFNHGEGDIGCHKFDSATIDDVECYDFKTGNDLIFTVI